MEQHKSSYGRGMNKDLSFDSMPNEMYLHAEDIRFFTDEGESLTSGINIKGTEFILDFSSPGERINGTTNMRNDIIIFTADSTDSHGRIYKLTYDFTDCSITTMTLIYDHPDMGFSVDNTIEAVSRYEDDCKQRVVFSDFNDYTRSINIADSCFSTGPYINPSSYCGIKPSDLDIFQGFVFNNPTINSVFGGGDLLSGMYQYAFKLVSKDGKETLISQSSNLTSIYPGTSSTNHTLDGGAEGENSGKSIKVDFDLSNIDLDNILYIQPISIFYNTLDGIPFIKQFSYIEVNNSTTIYSFIDSGSNTFTELTNEEYIINTFAFKTNKTFGVKDNLLLYSNVKEDCFVLDCVEREDFLTVRYKDPTQNNADYILSRPSPITTDPIEAQYYNPLNDESGTIFGNEPSNTNLDWIEQSFDRQSDGISLGGESSNSFVKYKFTLEPHTIASTSTPSAIDFNNGYNYNDITHDSIGDPVHGNLVRGYKRGEVYRFGIVFFNKDKGTPSYVYPIGDIKMPDISDNAGYLTIPSRGISDFPVSLTDGGKTIGYSLGLDFEFDFPQCLLDQVSGYQIVRVDRNKFDKTRLAQGMFKKYKSVANDPDRSGNNSFATTLLMDTIRDYVDDTKGDSTLFSLFTPETSYGLNSPSFKSGDYLRAVGVANNVTNPVDNYPTIAGAELVNSVAEVYKIPFHKAVEHTEVIKASERVFAGIGNRTLRDLDGNPIRNYATNDIDYTSGSGSSRGAFLGTNLAISLEKVLADPANEAPFMLQPGDGNTFTWTYNSSTFTDNLNDKAQIGAYVVDYARYLFAQYGGQGSINFSYNTFHAVTSVIDINTYNSPRVFQGDTFIGLYDYALHFWDDYAKEVMGLGGNNENNNSFYHVIYIPAETSINLDLDNGFPYHKGTGGYDFNDDGNTDSWRFKELNNDKGNYFVYNSVYSQTRKDKSFFPEPVDSQNCGCNVTRDVRTYISDPKINGETLDSWANVRANNFLDVDTQYGPINRLLNLKDEVFYLQDRSFGRFIINPRAVVATGDGVPTELGTGVGLQDFQYISTKYGCIHQFGCIATDSGIYYFDGINKKVYSYTGGNNPISDVKGFHGFLNYKLKGDVLLTKEQGGDQTINDKGVHCTFDYRKKEILFTFLGVDKEVYLSNFEDGAGLVTQDIILAPGTLVFYNGIYYKITGKNNFVLPLGTNVSNWVNDFLDNEFQITEFGETYRNGFTLVYSEFGGAFSHFLRPVPRVYLNNSNIILAPKPQDYNLVTGFSDDLHVYECGPYGEYFGEDAVELVLSFVVNSNSDINKILRFIEFNSTVSPVKEKGNFYDRILEPYENTLRDETITGIRIYNENQDTGKIDLSDTREFKGQTISKYLKRKFDKWRIKVPRDNQRTDLRNNHNNQLKGKMRSTYFVVELYYQNNNNKEFKLDSVITHYDFQMF